MIEYEHGIPIPGEIRPPIEWTQTAYKRFPPRGPLDWASIFGRSAPVVLELGCGNGRFTLQSALARADHDHFAIDILPVVIRYATRRANQRGLRNVRFAVKDAETLLHDYVSPRSAAEIHLYHPQPYHDTRQARRRLLTPLFLADVHACLTDGGLFAVQTDNPDYWDYLKGILPRFFDFQERGDPWPDAPEGRTRREIVARQRGLPIFRAEAFKQTPLDPAQLAHLTRTLPFPTFRSRGPWAELDREEHA